MLEINQSNNGIEKFEILIEKSNSEQTELIGEPSFEFARHHIRSLARKFGIKDDQQVVLESDLNTFSTVLTDLLLQYEPVYRISLDLPFAKQDSSNQAAPEDSDIQELMI